jgi:SAM-dependent methyltransferase
MISGREHLRDAYRVEQVAREYVARRFRSPLGALLHARQIGVLHQLIRDRAIEEAVEIAPGPARLTVDVAPLLKRVTLLDASAEMLHEARRRLGDAGLGARAGFVQTDAFQLPVGRPFDLVYTFRLIRHFERPDRLRLYRQISGVLKPSGWLVFDAVNARVSAPLRANAKPGEYEHFDALLDADGVRAELQEAGFTVESLVGVQRRYSTLMKCQVYLAPRSAVLARAAMEVVDRLGGEPLEWIVICRRG